MKKIMFLIILVPLVFASSLKIFYLDLEIYKNNTIHIKDFKVASGIPSDFPVMATNYKIKIYSFDKKIIWEKNLPVNFYVNLETLGSIPLEKTELNIKVPYFDNAKTITILYKNKEIYNIDVPKYVCNNDNVCNFGENKLNCPKDCGTHITFFAILFLLFLIFVAAVYFAIKKIMSLKSS